MDDPASGAVSIDVQVPSSGNLTAVSIRRVYCLIAQGNHSGRLTLKLAESSMSVLFRKGNPEHVESNRPDDAISVYLLSQKLTTPEQISQAEGAKGRFGGDLLAALFGLGLLNPNSTFALLAQRGTSMLARVLLAEAGEFVLEPEVPVTGHGVPLGNRWTVFLDILRRVPTGEIRKRLASVRDLPVYKSQGAIDLADLRLTPLEIRALNHVNGVHSLSELCARFPAEAESICRVVWMLRDLDVLKFTIDAKSADRSPNDTPVVASSPSPPPAKLDAALVERQAPASPEIDLQMHMKQLERMQSQNFFEMLGVARDAEVMAVKSAYFKLARQYHPDTVSQGAPIELAKVKAHIFASVGEAYRTLCDVKLRAAYVAELDSGRRGEKVDISALLRAEALFKRGTILIKARRFQEAVTVFTEAISENKEEGDFFIWRGFCRFFVIDDKKKGLADAIADISIGQKMKPSSADASYFLGVIVKLCGDVKTAKQHFQRCAELNPKHLDAQRELRLMK